MWTTWWRCASQIGSVCTRISKSSTGAWWRRAWLKPKTPPNVTPHLKLNPWWERGTPAKERRLGSGRLNKIEGVCVCACVTAWLKHLIWLVSNPVEISPVWKILLHFDVNANLGIPKHGVPVCLYASPDYGQGRAPGLSLQHFKRNCRAAGFQTEELWDKAENGKAVMSFVFLIKFEFTSVNALGL